MEKKKNKSKKTTLIIANIAVFVVVAIAIYWLFVKQFHIMDRNYTNSAQVEEFINPINTRVSGYIKEIRFTEHQHVKKGDTLLILDDREILTQLGQAEASYMNALAQQKVLTSSINTVSNNVNVADANIEGAKARLWNAAQNLKRYENLLSAQAATRQQFEQVKTEHDALKASYNVLVKQKTSANLATSEVQSRHQVLNAEIKRAESALAMAKLNLSYVIITAPYDGIMGRRLMNEGQLIQPGQQIATIVLNGEKWITANFLEQQMSKVKIGEQINITVDALNGQKFEGVITAISGATGARYSTVPVDNSTGNFIKVQQRIPVRIEFSANNKTEDLAQLRAGMNVAVTIK